MARLQQILDPATLAEVKEKIQGMTGTPAVMDQHIGETFTIKLSAPVARVMPASAIIKDEAALAALGDPNMPVGTIIDVPYYNGTTQFRDSARATVRRSFETARLPAGKYKVRIRRKQPKSDSKYIVDQLVWTELVEITSTQISYKNTALLGVKIRLGDEISSIPSVTALNHGIVIPVYDGTTWRAEPSNNPAWITRDIITNRRYAAGMSPDRIDMSSWLEWARWCDKNKLTFNGVFDSSMNLWDALAVVFRAGRAMLIAEGTRFSVAIEREEQPSMLFGEGNIIEGTYSEQWVPMKDRANEIEAQYYDQADNYKQKAVRLVDYTRLKEGEQSRVSSLTLFGIVDRERVYQEVAIHLAMNRLIRRVVKFSAPIQAIACRVGSVIYVMQDYPNWGASGKLRSHDGGKVVLDKPVKLDGDSKIMLMCDAQRAADAVILAITAANVIRVSAATSLLSNSACIVVNGEEYPIDAILSDENDAPLISLRRDLPAGVTVGSSCEVWQTHQIVERTVVAVAPDGVTLTLASPVPATLSTTADWIFGRVERIKKMFRVKSITGDGYDEREITAIEYNPAVYDPASIPGLAEVFPDIPRPLTISHVRDLAAWEESKITDTRVVSRAKVRWTTPNSGLYAGAEVYVSKNGAEFEHKATVKLATAWDAEYTKGDVLKIRVVAFDQLGKRPASEAPTVTLEITGQVDGEGPAAPGDDNGWGDCLQFTGKDCQISWRHSDSATASEFGSETSGVVVGDPTFRGYEVTVYTASGTLLRREGTPTNNYNYTYEKNVADTGNQPARYLKFEVRTLDSAGRASEPLVVKACNPAPRLDMSKLTIGTTFEAANVRYERPADPDWVGVKIWISPYKGHLSGGLGGMTELEYSLAQQFDHGHYYAAYYHTIKLGNASDLRGEMLAHYKNTGWKMGWNPNAYFDVNFYLAKYPDVKNSGVEPFEHFVTHGAAEGRIPNGTAQITGDAIARDALFYNGSEQAVNLGPLKPKTPYYLVIAAYDAFSESDVIRSDEIEFETGVIDADALGEQIIGDSQLLKDLRDRIALITSPEEVIGSVNERIKNAADAVNSRIDSSTATLREEIGVSKSETLDETLRLIDGLGTATASDIEALRATLGDTQALVSSESLARAAADESLANSLSLLQARTTDAEAAIVAESEARIADGKAVATQLSSIGARIGKAEGAILAESAARASDVGSLTSQYNSLTARMATAESSYSALNTWKASAQAEIDGKASAITVNQLSTTVSGHTTSISTLASSVNGINAEYMVKIDSNGKVSGFGLRSSGAVTKELSFKADTEFVIYADKFAFIPTGGSSKDYPFTIGPVGGVTRTVIKNALIQDAAISTLKIADNSVTIPGTSSRADTLSGASGKPIRTDVIVLNLTMPEAGYVFASYTSSQGFDRWPGSPNGYATGESDWGVTLRINGVEVANASGTMPGDSVSVSGSYYCPKGAVRISVDWYGAKSVRLHGRSLFGIGAVR